MKRKWIALMMSTLLLIVLAACGSSDDSTGEEERKDVTLSFGTHQSGIPRTGIMQEMAEDFAEETGIKIDFQVVPDAQWRDLIRAKLSTGEAPDIINLDVDPLSLNANLRPEDNALDLTDEEFASRMDEEILPSVSYNDKVYGVTYAPRKIWYVYYNKSIFEDLGLEIPTTYEEFKHVAGAIHETGVIPFWQAPGSGWYQVLPLFEIGPHYENVEPGTYEKLNNNEMLVAEMDHLKTVIEQVNEFADLGYYGENFISNTVEAGLDAFGREEAAMILRVPGTEQEIIDAHPEMDGNIGFFVMPWGDNQTIGVNPGGSAAMFGNQNSEHEEEIREFFRWMTKNENIQRFFDGGEGNLTISWPEIEPKLTPDYIEYEENLDSGTVMQAAVTYIDPQWMDIGKDISGMFAGALTPEQILENIDNRRAELAKVQQDPAWD
ncbi:ABC transporter substrate-binding protein [Halalkalibacter sp. APA_J-10(15)]|uniref:ABC transporter substrate-binding protein n=1 Tax=Halalkalibacter sp. APA_J-10(15) TaxID=2933805 RepID=UPI001FF526EB|nr:ABC transporter substrate-binding protein [Halalkalibacter sp. APA_J-10(15)]MCK0470188.1 ABC transporter substrate-binding protein [Halalkalibacter sp. APA_J-10(15)]